MDNNESQDRKSYERWQELAINQLGYTINLILTLASGVLAFGVNGLVDPKLGALKLVHGPFRYSLLLIGVSIIAALGANVTRACDFRNTRGAARATMKKDSKNHDDCQRKAECYGEWTWRLFRLQALFFALGIALLSVSLWVD